MPTIDTRIDAYIEKSADFAQPILRHVRELVHAACPEVEETMKWSMPHFMYKGIMCSMAAFKAHCAVNFWKGELLLKGADDKMQQAFGQFGRITSIKDLPAQKTLSGYIRRAMLLNEEGVKAPARAKAATPRPLAVPTWLTEALARQQPALDNFTAFSTSNKREYVEWLEEAKTEATRLRRLEQAIEWIAEGKTRNWKYAKC